MRIQGPAGAAMACAGALAESPTGPGTSSNASRRNHRDLLLIPDPFLLAALCCKVEIGSPMPAPRNCYALEDDGCRPFGTGISSTLLCGSILALASMALTGSALLAKSPKNLEMAPNLILVRSLPPT